MMFKSIALLSASGLAMAQDVPSFESLQDAQLPFLGAGDPKLREKNTILAEATNAVLDATYGEYDYDSIMSEVQTLLTANGVTHSEVGGDFAQNVNAPGRPQAAAASAPSVGGKDFTAEEGFTGTVGLTCQKCSGTLAFCAQASNNVAETCNESQGACRLRIEKGKQTTTMITMGCANYNSCIKQRNENSNSSGHPATHNCNDLHSLNSRFNHQNSVCHQCCTRDSCFSGDNANVVYTDASAATTNVDTLTSTDFASPAPNDGPNA